MMCWRGRPPESGFWPVAVIFKLGSLGWACCDWAWGVAFGSVPESNMEWATAVVWVLREGALPPSSIT
jgi:hypothetical protein